VSHVRHRREGVGRVRVSVRVLGLAEEVANVVQLVDMLAKLLELDPSTLD
jgi:hypothetical protein